MPMSNNIILAPRLLPTVAKVSDLIIQEIDGWNIPLLEQLFSIEEIQIILSVSLASVTGRILRYGATQRIQFSRLGVHTTYIDPCLLLMKAAPPLKLVQISYGRIFGN